MVQPHPSVPAIVAALLERHGHTYASEIGITLADADAGGSLESLFRLFCAAMLFSTRIRARVAVAAAHALAEQGWVTPQKMADSTWEARTHTLNAAGYARYDERTSRMLGHNVEFLLRHYAGDLRNLRQAAERDPRRERLLLKEFKGIGDVGVDIFFREVQGIWSELFPFVDKKVQQGAEKLGLPTDARELVRLVSADDFPCLVAGLVRVQLAGDYAEVLMAAQ